MTKCFGVLITYLLVCGEVRSDSTAYYEDSWKVPLSVNHKTALANYQEAQPRQAGSVLAAAVGKIYRQLN